MSSSPNTVTLTQQNNNGSIFGADKIIAQHISEADFCTYFVGFDLNSETGKKEYRWKPLINLLQSVIPEFAFGLHNGSEVPQSEITNRLCEAAKSVYKIDAFSEVKRICDQGDSINDDDPNKKYLSRGEFGELILHLLLRDFHDTIPLLSKIYFKDSYGATVHGFDAVHVQTAPKSLWLGESKIYKDGKKGLQALIEDIKNHIKGDYLQSEFSIISKKIKLCDEIPEKQYWLNLMHQNTKLSDILTSVTIPLLCTYTSNNFSNHDDESADEFIKAYETEVRGLQEHFENKNDHPLKTNLNIVLLLFPVKSKDELVKRMHKKLSTLQSIEDE